MDAYLLLSDAAQKDASGKVGLLGAGWTITGPKIPMMAITVFIRIGWDEAKTARTFRLRLLDDTDEVVATTDDEEQRIEFGGQLGLNEASDVVTEEEARLVDISTAFTVNVQPPQLEGGRRYRWAFLVDDAELASYPFVVRRAKTDA